MNKRFLSVIAIFGAVAFTVSSCSDEVVTIDNSPQIPNNLTIDGIDHEQVVASCSQGTYFSISASSMNGASHGSIGLTFYGTSAPSAGAYQVVKTPPQAGQVTMQMVPNVQTPSQNFQADSGQVINVIISDGSSVATFTNIVFTQTGTSATKIASGSLGCYSETNPGTTTGVTTGGTTTGGSTFTLGTSPAVSVTGACMAALGDYMVNGINASGSNVSVTFSGASVPAAGSYTLVSVPSPSAGEAYLQVSDGTTAYKSIGGQATVALVSGKAKVSFNNIPVEELGDTIVTTVSGMVTCP